MDLHARLNRTVLVPCLALCAAGCALAAAPSSYADRSAFGSHAAETPLAPVAGGAFEGDWYYGSDCDFGHYVNLGLKRVGNGYIGDWSDGTRVRGSQGNLQGKVRNGELVAQLCDDGNDVGGVPDCPKFEEPHDIFVRSGDHLVWSYVYDGKRTQYVTLHRAELKVDMRADCIDEADTDDDE